MTSSENRTLAEVNKEWDERLKQYADWRQEYEKKVNAKNTVNTASDDADKKKEASPRSQRKKDTIETGEEAGLIPITTMDTSDVDLLPPPALALWICQQRLLTNKNRNLIGSRNLLTLEKERRFQAVDGFPGLPGVYKPSASRENTLKYDLKLAKLRHFKERFGHVNVPIRWREDKQLGKWCSEQRYIYRHNDPPLNPKKKAALNALGFVWFKPPSNKTEYIKDPSHPLASFQHVNRKRKEKKEKGKADKNQLRNIRPKAAPTTSNQQQPQLALQHEAASISGQPYGTKHYWEICTNFPTEPLPHPQQQHQQVVAAFQPHMQAPAPTSAPICNPVDAITLMAKDKAAWYRYYSKARAYYQIHGHCSIPPGLLEDDSLCAWINVQKHVLGSSQERPEVLNLMLDQNQLAALEEIGIVKPEFPKESVQILTHESGVHEPQSDIANTRSTELLESSLNNASNTGDADQETNQQRLEDNNSDSDDEPYFTI